MATETIIPAETTWIQRGSSQTTWANLMMNTTGDVGSIENVYPGLNIQSVYITGTMTSVSVLEFQGSISATGTFAAGFTVCGTAMSFDSTTGTGLSTGVVYLVRPGDKAFKPKITAGASGAEDLTVVFVQSR
jgi:hypothetical protein